MSVWLWGGPNSSRTVPRQQIPVVEAMGQVTVTLNGRSYRLRCGDGDEARLRSLAADVQSRIETLANEFGQVGDERLLVMAALLINDDLWDLRVQLGERARVSGDDPAPAKLASGNAEAKDASEDEPSSTGSAQSGNAAKGAAKKAVAEDEAAVPDSPSKRAGRAPGHASLNERLSEVATSDAVVGRRGGR